MQNNGSLKGKTLFITGASRGIGKAIALKAARDGANVVIAAKTSDPHPKLPGTIFTTAEEVEKAGGKALACIVDVRDENQVRAAVKAAVDKFGGIDILVNNASAISLTTTLETEMKRYDLMHNINGRGAFLVSKECLPYLLKSNHAHILNISPPLSMKSFWFSRHVAYTIAKYGMSMCVLGMAEEFKDQNIAINALWPQTTVHTAAVDMLYGSGQFARTADIMADAAYVILSQIPSTCPTGQFLIDEKVLRKSGVTDFTSYAVDPSKANLLHQGYFLEESNEYPTRSKL
ncbi:hydroxysteroid dehydrogenase-like protein 2 [Stomoxys calcitrans]|uniref:hydroxysteroid dehydrogenase-like protein 2 n=1 Tax=Stomoxys calcitrans TaxID=35570 RepID=UPI0027E23919|nr:hydroxysteroid dehydrogenase-like protein 2 [Stomoxys calcitrans]